jgi:fructokinase
VLRIGIDLGGSKIEAAAWDASTGLRERLRVPTPGDYPSALRVVAELVAELERRLGGHGSVGVGMPGTIVPDTGLVKNANSEWLNGQPLGVDLGRLLGREVRCANDANCFAVSEAADGAGAGHRVVFAAILGTGCGAGLVVDGRAIEGRAGLAGEWGHNGLPWPGPDEHPGPDCYCGKYGCLEMWVSGPGFEADYRRRGGPAVGAVEIARAAEEGDLLALDVLGRYEDRLARGLGTVVNLIDPDVIVLGGGMSNVERLYRTLPQLVARYAFGGECTTPVRRARFGDSSGVRGAAWLWGKNSG